VLHRRVRIVVASGPVRCVLRLVRVADLPQSVALGTDHTPLSPDELAG